MFIAMNRFKVKNGSEEAFEKVWATRESYLGRMAGFVEFHLLEGPGRRRPHAVFLAHGLGRQGDLRGLDQVGRIPQGPCPRRQQDRRSLYLDHPKFEGFEVIQSQRKSSAAA